jgi:GR25 family glycosyltransferase involved in LPS biosynthesis
MKSFVITVCDLDQSIKIANRCILSANSFGLEVNIFKAVTPKDDPLKILLEYGINHMDFTEKYSRKLNGISCFLSHYMLWKKCLEIDEDILIFEHDAVVVDKIPNNIDFNLLLSLGKPSFGSYKIPALEGVNNLTSKSYLPGAHSYIIKPEAAKILISQASIKANYTDVFLNLRDFPWLQEYYPWPVIADDTFTTVQKTEGCIAKHSYKKGFDII